MKKNIIKIISLLFVFIIFNNLVIYADNTTQINGQQPIFWYLYGKGSLGENDNLEKVYMNYSNGQNAYNLKINDGDHVWIKGMDSLIKYVSSNTVESITANNEYKYIQDAYEAIEHFSTYLNDEDFLEKQSLESFKKYTGYNGDRQGVLNYFNDKYPAFSNKILAAADQKKGTGLFTLNYKGLFSLNYSSINSYISRYGTDLFPGNLTAEQKNNISRVWKFKNQKYKEDVNSEVARSSVFVDLNDTFETKMGYNRNQIMVYQALWGNNYNVSNNEEKKALQIEWAFVRETGDHTNNYKQNYINGHTPYTIDENNNIKYLYYSDNDKKTAEDNNWIQGLENAGNVNKNTSLDLNAQASLPSDVGALGDAVQRALNKKYGEIYSLPEKTNSKNGDTENTDMDTIVSSANSFINDNGNEQTISDDNIKEMSDSIYNILLIVGVIIAVIVGAIIGIKFMTGSVEEKANIKELLIPYIVGCVVVFGAFGIWKIAVMILNNI